MKKISREKEKTTIKAQKALNRLSKGKDTINHIRQEYGLNRLETNDADKKLIIID